MASSSSFNLALFLDRIWPPEMFRVVWIIGRLVFILSLFLFLFGFLTETFSLGSMRFFLGLTLLSFAFCAKMFLVSHFRIFLTERADGVSFEALKTLEAARVLARRKKLSEVSSHLVCLVLLEQNPSLKFILLRALLDARGMISQLQNAVALLPRVPTKQIPYGEDLEKALAEALSYAKERNRKVSHGMLFAALSRTNPVLKDILTKTNLEPEDLFHLVSWQERLEKSLKKRKHFWLKENLQMKGSLARDWATAYTITLDRFVIDRTEEVRRLGFPRVVGHAKEMKAIERVLTRQERHHVILIGEPGSGKKNMVWDLASVMALGQTTPEIAYFKLLELKVQELVAQAQSKEETETLLNRIFQEAAAAGNVILFLDDIQNFAPSSEDSGETPGLLNIKGALAPYLTMPEFRFVAATTFGGLHLTLEQDPSFLSFFESVEVQEISQEQTLEVLELRVGMIEHRSRCFLPYPALKEVVRLAEKYIQGTPFPKKAVDLLEEAVSFLLQTKERVLLPGHVAAVLTEKTQIPVGIIETKERETLLNLEDLLHKRIVNQEEGVDEVAAALRRSRTEVASRKGPMGSFLFLGPTGVGKTETAKALAAVYFGSESRMVRLDMSEFQNPQDIGRLLGSKDQEGLLTTPIRENPFCLVLLDELEKANANILNLFLQVLDEGHVTDGLGRKVSFLHTIIIATSNAGYQFILEAIKEKADFKQLKQRMLDYLFSQGIYRPEFLNRFDGVIIFTPLTKEHLKAIAHLMLSKIRENLEKRGIQLVITEPLKEKVAELGYDPTFGARNMRRVIQDKIENALAEAVLRNKLQPGTKVEINPQDFTLKIS
ncbi:MAG: ATP-dependent Clp protease ATP-binding subunit [Parcubacteria group bacterium]|nr:ATP-dependent Clp protease ATP-binding subunit [Parcubacteria group bacterium]